MNEEGLTDNWLQQPYDFWMAEARRIGALIGPATHLTRWKPVTCRPHQCVLFIASRGWTVRAVDDKRTTREIFMPDPTKPIIEGGVEILCFHHQAVSATLLESLLKESRLVTGFLSVLGELLPDLFENRRLLQKHPYKWEFDTDRNLVVDIRKFPPEKLADIRAIAADSHFKGRLIING